MFQAFAPYIIIVVVLGLASLHPIQNQLNKATSEFSWPGLNVLTGKGKAPTSETFKANWFTAAGTWLLVSGILTMLVLRVRPSLVDTRLRPHAGSAQVGDPDRLHGGPRGLPT